MSPSERYEQTLRRKLREAWLAWQLERTHTKDELLALYLNQTYYGNFVFGLEAAGQIFFGKPASQLSRGECTLLAGLVQYPTGYNPLQHPDAAKQRQSTVLRLMQEAGYLETHEAQTIAGEPLRYRSRLFDIEAPHFVMYVQDLLVLELGADRLRDGGLRVRTSLDLNLQHQAESSVLHRLDLVNCRVPGICDSTTDGNRRVDNAAAVVLDSRNGDILAMVGSPDYFDENIHGNVNSTLSLRQPGSAIKPLTYAAALDPGWNKKLGFAPLTPASILADLPVTYHVRDENGGNVPYQPLNYDRLYHGPVSVRTALANSYNIPAVSVLDTIGVETLRSIATQAGIGSLSGEYGLALTLGGGEVTLLELTAAYAIFNEGRRMETRAVLEIQEQAEGGGWRTLLSRPVQPRPGGPSLAPLIAPSTAYLITDILSDPVARIPAFGTGSALDLPFPAAVKTGTTTDWRDNWTIGYSTERIVGVWVGNADNTPMLDVSGIEGAGPIWHDLMLAAHRGNPVPFEQPGDIITVEICGPSGMLPSPSCRRTRRELFIDGTEPDRPDDQFQTIDVDLTTSMRATADTPADRRIGRVFWLLPTKYVDWMIGQGIAVAPPLATGDQMPQEEMTAFQAVDDLAPLVLTTPIAHTAYQIHPGVPRARQRIEVASYVRDGVPWSELRLVRDGVLLDSGNHISRLQSWWILEEGSHHFWVEGRQFDDSPFIRSQPTYVQVDAYGQEDVAAVITIP